MRVPALWEAGKSQLGKVAAQLLANMSANEGPALHAVWAACFPKTFTDLAAFRSERGPQHAWTC
jgi:hypothetical protein